MAKKSKKKPVSFRQRLRVGATKRLDAHCDELVNQAKDIADRLGVKPSDLLKYASGGQIKTLEETLVTVIANKQEAELEEIYNGQMDLIPEKADASKKEG